ncbi:MAG: NAD(P)/FAD-dependent oxidoreductase [Actinobacteria bacterium]|nr:NAD(P)/FAD-dependent oxidoreductase [Actinomycetota bacterium]
MQEENERVKKTGKMERYDLIVVGAGPGGSTAALTAAEAGMKVLVLERSRYPAEKNAGGFALSSKAWRDFPFIRDMELPSMRRGTQCVAHFLSPPPEMEERFCIASGVSRRAGYPEAREFFTVTMLRREFDRFLADRAVEAGAELRFTSLVTGLVKDADNITSVVLEGGDEIRAPVVIGADGVMSATARLAGLREKWRPDEVISACAVDYSASRERLDDVVHEANFQAYFGPGMGGNYLMSYADCIHIGGPGVTNSLISRVSRTRIKPARELLETIQAPPVQRLLRAVDAVPREFHVHCVPWKDSMSEDIYAGGLMLVGDAAGLPEPLWAEGVWQAMYSGRLAAQVAQEAIGEGDVSAAYLARYLDRLRDSPVAQEFIGGAQLRQLFEVLGDPQAAGEMTEMVVDLTVNMFMSGQEPKAQTVARAVPILMENLPVLMKLLGIYLPMIQEGGGELPPPLAALGGMDALFGAAGGEEPEP